MLKQRFEKYFSVAEANELIPRLEAAVRELQAQTAILRNQLAQLAALDSQAPTSEGEPRDLEKIIQRHPELRELTEQIAGLAAQIEDYGCFLKDIDLGLVDFPSELGNEVVFLCWQFGERQISAWHSIDGGFSSRRPISGAPKPYLN